MKVILSRKAFDSGAGKVANPILEDGSMIPLPIPDKSSLIRYQDITVAGQNLGSVASYLTGGRTKPEHFAHLDPDLAAAAYPRAPGWRPMLGQTGAAQTVLAREGVGIGDLFLFFGWFRQVTRSAGRLQYVRGAPDLHVLWGWLQVDDLITVSTGPHPAWMAYHPHLAPDRKLGSDTLYVARERLRIDGVDLDIPGAGTFGTYDDHLRLTAPGQSRSVWSLPAWFAPSPPRPPLGYHSAPERWHVEGDRVHLRSVGRGQEFVLDTDWYPRHCLGLPTSSRHRCRIDPRSVSMSPNAKPVPTCRRSDDPGLLLRRRRWLVSALNTHGPNRPPVDRHQSIRARCHSLRRRDICG